MGCQSFLNAQDGSVQRAVQAAARKLMKLDLLTEEDNIYFIPDILFRMYLQRLKNTNIIFIPS